MPGYRPDQTALPDDAAFCLVDAACELGRFGVPGIVPGGTDEALAPPWSVAEPSAACCHGDPAACSLWRFRRSTRRPGSFCAWDGIPAGSLARELSSRIASTAGVELSRPLGLGHRSGRLRACGGLAQAASRASGPLPPAGSPNVLLIVLDTVRADRLSIYGYHRPTTPTLVRLAEGGIRFDGARAIPPWTRMSHARFFSGRWPHELDVEWETPLPQELPRCWPSTWRTMATRPRAW